jgi:hypothetical protein
MKTADPWSDEEVAKQIDRRVWWGAVLSIAAAAFLYGGCAAWGHWMWRSEFCKAAWGTPPWVLFSGLATVPALLLLWRWRTTHKAADIATAKQQAVTADAQRILLQQQHASAHFSSAIGLISHENELVQIGGIHALEAVAIQSPSGYGVPVRKTLCSYLRESLRLRQQHSVVYRREMAVPAALTALGSLGPGSSLSSVDLRDLDFGSVSLRDANFCHANFGDARLKNSVLMRVNFSGAHMAGINLESSDLRDCTFEDVSMYCATLVDADCRSVNFSRAYLRDTDFTRAQLDGANFDGSDLSDVKGLTQEQLDTTVGQPAAVPPGVSSGRTKSSS